MDLFNENEKIINFEVENDEIGIKEFLDKQNLSSRLFRKLYK